MQPRHIRFVQEYLIDRNGAAAAIRAGYSPRTARQIAYELLTRPDVAEAVAQGEVKLAAEANLSREAALKGFQEAIEVARQRGDPSAMIAGWREIAKMCGYYAPERKQIQLSADVRAQRAVLEQMTDAELLELIAEDEVLSTAN
jgi:phage terminase small subunit